MRQTPPESGRNDPEKKKIELPGSEATGAKQNRWILLLVFLPCFVLMLHMNNDLWFLLNSGRYVLQHGIPTIEPFTLHQNFSFVMQQWLTAGIFWVVYSKLGAVGILALVFLLYCAVVAVICALCWHISGGNVFATFLGSILSSAMLKLVMVSRPMSFTLLILICELYLVERFISSSKPRFLLPLPVLSALLVNLHAAMWPLQFVLLLPYIIDAFRFKFWILEGQGYAKRYFVPAIALMCAAGFLNPYGWSGMTYVFRSYGFAEISFVSEMQPPNIGDSTGMVIFGALFLVLAFYLFKKERETKLRYALLTLGTAVLTLSSMRSVAFFAICGFFPLSYLMRNVTLPENKITSGKGLLRLRIILITLVVLVTGAMIAKRVILFAEESPLPEVANAVNYLVEKEPQENMKLYVGYNDGGYAEFMGLKPYLDPRAEVFVKKNNHVSDVMKEYYLLQNGELYYKTVLEKYQFTHLLVSKGDILFTYLPHDVDYERVFQDGDYVVYRKR